MAKGIILGEEGAVVKNGDFVIGNVDEQNIQAIMRLHPGNAKNDPLLYVSVSKHINAPAGNVTLNALAKRIKLALQRDGVWKIGHVKMKGFDNISIIAEEV